jgi:hypothetical protein
VPIERDLYAHTLLLEQDTDTTMTLVYAGPVLQEERNSIARNYLKRRKTVAIGQSFYQDNIGVDEAAVKVQSVMRGFLARRQYYQMKRLLVCSVEAMQCSFKSFVSYYKFKEKCFTRMLLEGSLKSALVRRNATEVIQSAFSSLEQTRMTKQKVLEHRNVVASSIIIIQTSLLSCRFVYTYQKLQRATFSLQERFRKTLLCLSLRRLSENLSICSDSTPKQEKETKSDHSTQKKKLSDISNTTGNLSIRSKDWPELKPPTSSIEKMKAKILQQAGNENFKATNAVNQMVQTGAPKQIKWIDIDGGGNLECYTPAGSGTVNFNLQPKKSIIKKSTHSKQSDKPSMNSYGIKLESRKGIFGSLRFLAGKIPHGKAARISSQTSNLPFNYY